MHPIIALWSHPRSMSTAMERMMRERGDLDCAHEPFMYDYYVHRKVRDMPHFDIQANHPVAYQDIRDMLVTRARERAVFFKDMSYYVMPHILNDASFQDKLTNCFLIRNPMASILSYFKLDPDVTLDEIGLEAQWKHYCALKDSGQNPIVIEAETVRNNTRDTMAKIWDAVGLSFSEDAFDWQDKGPKDWEQVGGWHGDVSTSRSIQPLMQDEAAEQERRFYTLAAEMPKMLTYLEYHQPYYLQLQEAGLVR